MPLFVVALLCGLVLSSSAGRAQTGPAGLVGTWNGVTDGMRAQAVFRPDGTFTRTLVTPVGTDVVSGRYQLQRGVLVIQPQGGGPIRLAIRAFQGNRMTLAGEDGSQSELVRASAAAPAGGKAQRAAPAPAPAAVVSAPAARPAAAMGNGLAPAWVRPGLRLTYYLMSGSLSGSVNGYVLDDEGRFVDRHGRRYSTERTGHSSHGLIQITVAGAPTGVTPLSESFYLFNGNDTTPVLNMNLDTVAQTESGGDFWMHPRKQAQMIQQHPWAGTPMPGRMMARATSWRANNQSYSATAIISLGEMGKTFWVYDQASGRLLYLSRLTRQPPDIRDYSQTLQDSVSYATFLRFVAVRQMSFPWLDMPLPDWARGLQALSYRGQMNLQFTGAGPGGQGLAHEMQVARRGPDWLLFQAHSQSVGLPGGSDAKAVSGTGIPAPVIIPPAALARLQPGQVIDSDPQTRYSIRVAGADAQSVTLQMAGGGQSKAFVYDRAQGVMVRSSSRERTAAGTGMVTAREMQLVGKR